MKAQIKEAPIRYRTGACSAGPCHAQFYDIDPVDGPMGKTYLCPGNLGEADEFYELDHEGKPLLDVDGSPVMSGIGTISRGPNMVSVNMVQKG